MSTTIQQLRLQAQVIEACIREPIRDKDLMDIYAASLEICRLVGVESVDRAVSASTDQQAAERVASIVP